MADVTLENLAREIYWAAYDQYLGEEYAHPKGFTKEVAWQRCSEGQRVFCRYQAMRAATALGHAMRMVKEEINAHN